MPLRFYNTLTNRVEDFSPVEPQGPVRMYSCGPTVYDFAHIGNFRSFLFADLLRRTLELVGYDVQHAMNITDVGHMTDDTQADGGGQDKMALAAERLAQKQREDKKAGRAPEGTIDDPGDPYQVAAFYTDAFIDDARRLGIKMIDEPGMLPRATDHIADMQAMITTLIERGHAYDTGAGVVYFSVQSFPDYGTLSGNTLEALKEGEGGRVLAQDQAGKRHPADFLLWKKDAAHLMKWDAPWGTGYPGWHIECSAIARRVLGAEVIDIHTGGEDLIFPHHECEIAQSRCATGHDRFARFFMHARFLLVEGAKMSKSKGNFYTVRDVLEGRASATGRAVDPAVLRYALLRTHYRANLNFTTDGLSESAGAVAKLRKLRTKLAEGAGVGPADRSPAEVDDAHPLIAGVSAALGDDLNISAALGELFGWAGAAPMENASEAAESLAALDRIDDVLAVVRTNAGVATTDAGGETPGGAFDPTDVCAQIDRARANKDFAAADALRQQLIDAGYEVSTTKDGTVAEKALA